MKRWIACGVAAGWVAGAWAAGPAPVSVYPPTPADLPTVPPAAAPTPIPTLPGTVVPYPSRPTTTRPVTQAVTPAAPAAQPAAPATPDVTKPLSSVLDAAPATPAGMPAATTIFPTDAGCTSCAAESRWRIPRLNLNLGLGSSPCVEKARCFFAWKPGPRVMPVCTPTPYQPPLRHYFPVGASTGGAAAAPACGTGERAPFFGPRLLNGGRVGAGGAAAGGCATGGGRSGKCDGCHEGVVEKAVGCLTPRQFGRLQPNCWNHPGAPQVSDCARGGCDGTAAGAVGAVPVGGGIYPGIGGGYRFASPVYVPPAQAITASGSQAAGMGGGVGSGTVGGNVGAVGTGAPGGGTGAGTGGGPGGAGGTGGTGK